MKEHELYHQLRESARFQMLFMASLSHQLRSPLGALLEQLKNFEAGVVDITRFSKRLAYAIGQVKVCALLVANLTYMDKILRGETFTFTRVNLTKLAIETKIDFEHLASDRSLKIVVDGESCDRYFPGFRGHGELMRQVLFNLIDNAIKYSDKRSVVKVVGKEAPGRVYLEVSSKGLRIAPEDRRRIFERGTRLRQAEELIPDGTGLGLWLVRKIIAAHKGEILCTEIFEGGEARTAFQMELSGQSPAFRRN